MKNILTFLLVACFYGINAQEWCAADKVQADLEAKNPSVKKARLDSEAKLLAEGIRNYLKKAGVNYTSAGKASTMYEIPVVVHVIVPTGAALGTQYNKTDAEIAAWIDNTNKIYATTYGNGYYTEGTGNDGGTVIPIKLVLAKRNPQCQPTTGIIRYDGGGIPDYNTYGVEMDTSDGADKNEIRSAFPHWPESSYFNIYVINKVDGSSSSGTLGWAYQPTAQDSSYDSFMMSYVVTNRPKTLAHEFGHALGLYHTFNGGDTGVCPTNNDCTTDNDKVCDTPPMSKINGNTMPTNSDTNPCTGQLYEGVQYNVMSYGNDTRKFTPGQRDRALTVFLNLRSNLTQSLGGTALPGTPIAASCAPTAVTNLGNYNAGPILVQLGTINNRTEGQNNANGNQFYIDYTTQQCTSNLSTELIVTDPQNIQVNIKQNTQSIRVWIDYNNNGTFDTGELATYANSVAASGSTETVWNGTFTAPVTTVLNMPLRMRVVAGKNASTTDACANLQIGQMEDYTVIFKNGTVSKNSSVITTKDKSFSIYPNPSHDGDFYIRRGDIAAQNIKIEIADASGRRIYQSELKENQKELKINSHLSNGVYFVSIKTGNTVQTEKIIIKR